MTKSIPSKKSIARNIGQSKSINNYNIFYILEREFLLKQIGCTPKKISSEYEKQIYGDLASSFPARPSRYESLELPDNWYLKRSTRSRDRSKKKRSVSQKGLSSTIASNWKSCDADVKSYVTTVSKIIKERHDEIQSSKSGTKSPAYSPLSEDSSPEFEPTVSVNQEKDARRVSMSSSASSHAAFLQKAPAYRPSSEDSSPEFEPTVSVDRTKHARRVSMSSSASSHGAFLQKEHVHQVPNAWKMQESHWRPDARMPQMMQQHYQDKMINAVLNHIKAGTNGRALDIFSPSYETTHIHALGQNTKPAAQYENIFCQPVKENTSEEWAEQFLEACDQQNECKTSSAKEAACQSVTKRGDGGLLRMERYGQYEIAINRSEHYSIGSNNKCGWEQGLENLIDNVGVSSDCASKTIGLVDMPDDDIREFFRVA